MYLGSLLLDVEPRAKRFCVLNLGDMISFSIDRIPVRKYNIASKMFLSRLL